MMIRATRSKDAAAIIALAKISQFDSDEVELIRKTLADYLNGNSNDLWFTAADEELVGVIYCTLEPMTKGTWNILLLLVSPKHHGQGYGTALISYVEETLIARNARLIIVETSSLDEFVRARAFYHKCGYTEEGRIRDFYEAGNDKIIFSKKLVT